MSEEKKGRKHLKSYIGSITHKTIYFMKYDDSNNNKELEEEGETSIFPFTGAGGLSQGEMLSSESEKAVKTSTHNSSQTHTNLRERKTTERLED